MKKLGVFVLFVFCVFPAFAQDDIIMKRDGSEMEVRVIQMNSKYVVYNLEDKNDKEDKQMDNKEIYMIKFHKRGNVFFTINGDRFDGDTDGKVPKKSTVVYLKEGKELVVYDLSMDTNKIVYKLSKKKDALTNYTPKYQVFMIVYPDGTKDIISEFEKPKTDQKVAQVPDNNLKVTPVPQPVSRPQQVEGKPRAAEILTDKNKKIEAIIVSEDGNAIHFYRKGMEAGPLYSIGVKHITRIDEIKPNNNKRNKKRR